MTDFSLVNSDESEDSTRADTTNVENTSKTTGYDSTADTEVSFSAFMTAVSLFFIGLLLDGDPNTERALQIPLIYLFASSFAFFYSALIYANTSSQSPAVKKHDRGLNYQFNWANALSESLGVYCLGFALPLTVIAYAETITFPMVVLGMHFFGFIFYHGMGFSIIERNIRPIVYKILIGTILTCYIVSVKFYLTAQFPHFYIVSSILGVVLIITFFITGHESFLQPEEYQR